MALLGLLVLASVVGRLVDRNAQRHSHDGDVEPVASPASRAWDAARARGRRAAPALPEGHRPPYGLGPISPSERFLRGESARGLREIQLWLLEQRTPWTGGAAGRTTYQPSRCSTCSRGWRAAGLNDSPVQCAVGMSAP